MQIHVFEYIKSWEKDNYIVGRECAGTFRYSKHAFENLAIRMADLVRKTALWRVPMWMAVKEHESISQRMKVINGCFPWWLSSTSTIRCNMPLKTCCWESASGESAVGLKSCLQTSHRHLNPLGETGYFASSAGRGKPAASPAELTTYLSSIYHGNKGYIKTCLSFEVSSKGHPHNTIFSGIASPKWL